MRPLHMAELIPHLAALPNVKNLQKGCQNLNGWANVQTPPPHFVIKQEQVVVKRHSQSHCTDQQVLHVVQLLILGLWGLQNRPFLQN